MNFLVRSLGLNLAIIGICLAAIFLWMSGMPKSENSGVRNPADNPYEDTIAASGIVESADRNIEIGAPSAGIITKIFVKVSDPVNEGEALFQVDPRELEAQNQLQKAKVDVAEATLKRLNDQLKRLSEISDPRAVSKDLLETRENDVKVARAELLANQAEVNQTEKLIERLTVRAPRKGVILQNNIRVGEYYSPTNNSPPAMLLGDIDQLQVRVDIDEQNASRFRPEFTAVAFPKNNPLLEIPLKFDRVEPYVIPKRSLTGASNERVDTRVLQVIYTFKNPENFKIFVGQQVDVFINENS